MMLLNDLSRAWSVATTKHSNLETKHQPMVFIRLRHSLDAGLGMPRNIGITISITNHAFGARPVLHPQPARGCFSRVSTELEA